jgi:hypothetical protein
MVSVKVVRASHLLKAEQERANRDNEGVDYLFDAPVEIAFSVTGYRHDRDLPALNVRFVELLKNRSALERRSLVSRLFRR